jgi:aspartate/methionine/tyrosine aminotransferase
MVNPIFAQQPPTIFDVMSSLARDYDAINLGQGFPDADGALDVRQQAAQALTHASNQYPPSPGLPALRHAVAEHYGRLQGLSLDGMSEVVVTSGATEAIAAAILALVSPGDEVVMFQPTYDIYLPLDGRGAGRRVQRSHPRGAVQQPAQSRRGRL